MIFAITFLFFIKRQISHYIVTPKNKNYHDNQLTHSSQDEKNTQEREFIENFRLKSFTISQVIRISSHFHSKAQARDADNDNGNESSSRQLQRIYFFLLRTAQIHIPSHIIQEDTLYGGFIFFSQELCKKLFVEFS